MPEPPDYVPVDIDLRALLENLPEFDSSSVCDPSPPSSPSSLPPSPSPSPSPAIPPQHLPQLDPTHLESTASTPPEDGPIGSNVGGLGARGSDRQKKKSHARRKVARQKAKAAKKLEELTATPEARRKYLDASSAIDVEMDATNFPASSSGYIGAGDSGGRRVFKIQDLVGPQSKYGLRLINWDGVLVFRDFFNAATPTDTDSQHTYTHPRPAGPNHRSSGWQAQRPWLDSCPSTSRRRDRGMSALLPPYEKR